KSHIVGGGEIVFRDRKRVFARIEQMQMPDARRDHDRPASAAASNIHADRFGRQIAPWKDMEVGGEDSFAICRRELGFALAERRPFVAKARGDASVDVLSDVLHEAQSV